MGESYEDIPKEGKHLTDDSEHVSGFNVRAQKPPAPDEYDGGPADALYQLTFNKKKGHYRVQYWTAGEIGQMEEGYVEHGRYTADEDLAAAVGEMENELQYVVLENLDTGEVFFDRESKLTDNWTDQGDFDRMTLFEEEPEAAAYAEERRRELQGETENPGAGEAEEEE